MGPTPVEQPPKATPKLTAMPFQKSKQLQRDIEHITQEMYKRNKELADTNKTLSLLRTIDALVLESHASLAEVCTHITEAITQATDFPFVGLFAMPSHSKEEMTLFGYSGRDPLNKPVPLNFSEPIHLRLSNDWLQQSETSKLFSIEALTTKQMATWLQCHEADIERNLKRVPLKSLYVVKLRVRRLLVGLLVVGFSTPATQLTELDTLLLDRLSETIGVAMDNKLLFEENQRMVHQLKASNSKLKALDETKDDFISMASHQLRTPLTSVKGYLSMVLEGDTGKISAMQQKMLGQAFFSSQRMVYLIADLLNVSRLKTGKFIIEAAPVNLADVVEQEMSQLKETAASRNLTLSYDKPKHFPMLMLDETKTRQVIMNFADNAIYYTPAGGHITVKLTETPTTIEFRVVDNGIGVPKGEQPHLFTKFYRAGNARQARPDGTGLGLFMAKKVIIGQGGALIFESKEGKGSTFGFIFSKSKLTETPKTKLTEVQTTTAVKPSRRSSQTVT